MLFTIDTEQAPSYSRFSAGRLRTSGLSNVRRHAISRQHSGSRFRDADPAPSRPRLMLIDGQFPVAAPPPALLAHLFDARLMASCLPGCETLEPLDDDRYRAVVVIAMAGIKARFDLQVEVTRRDESQIWAVT